MANPNNGLSLGIKKFNVGLMEPAQNVRIPTISGTFTEISGTFTEGETVTATSGEWVGEDLEFTYQFNDGIEGTSPNYTLQVGDSLTGVYVTVRATNRVETVSAVSTNYTVAEVAP